MCKAEDVINKEQDVLAFFVSKILGLCKTGQRNPGTGAWRLVHLAIDQCRTAFALEIDNFGVLHFVIQIITFAGPLANTGKHRITAEQFCDIVDQLLNQNCFTNTRAAEETNFSAFCVRAEQVDDFNAGHEDFGFC
ncbi:MAG: Uncharacterised protein [Hyphomonas sp. TMED17]|nr:MAG: Uncharacterised protein [Hyphomonas sp. TMED17]